MHGPEHPLNEALLGELRALENLLPETQTSPDFSALIRLIQEGGTLSSLLQLHGLDEWLVLPLGRDKFPALAMLQEKISSLSFQRDHDSLTGLLNRRAFDAAMGLEVERATRFKSPVSLCVMDLDNFKSVNDTYGHPCGDKILQTMAHILLEQTRKIDIAARIGGEEFGLILPGTGQMRAQILLDRILNSIRSARVVCGTTELGFSCSMGLASYRGKQVPDQARMLAEADKALYQAKRDGKNRIEAAPILDLGHDVGQTQVRQNEKRFLFSSFAAPTSNIEPEKD